MDIPFPFDLANYNYQLPEELIAQHPASARDKSRLLAYEAGSGEISQLAFSDIVNFFSPGDLLVVNDTKVFPARIIGHKESGGRVEFLVLEFPQRQVTNPDNPSLPFAAEAWVLARSSRRMKPGQKVIFANDLQAEVLQVKDGGKLRVAFLFNGELGKLLDDYGQIPLPPYIKRDNGEEPFDRDRYQTVYASSTGAVAAPTAGLHFSEEMLDLIRSRGLDIASVTLHVGYGTFAPVREQDIRNHQIHSEYVNVSGETADKINEVVRRGGRVWPVGTTTVRTLEFAADDRGVVKETSGWCDLYIYPGYRFKLIKNLITNFHLPGSSLLFLVSALIGKEELMTCYQRAIAERFRFFSYGDAMIIFNPEPES